MSVGVEAVFVFADLLTHLARLIVFIWLSSCEQVIIVTIIIITIIKQVVVVVVDEDQAQFTSCNVQEGFVRLDFYNLCCCWVCSLFL